MWLRRETDDMSMGLLIYETPYRDTSDLNPQHLVAVRDSVVKKYVPGPLDGTYMTTDKNMFILFSRCFRIFRQAMPWKCAACGMSLATSWEALLSLIP